ncbi:hypothetical protein WKV53_05400 [Luteolibacter sp. Y139]|uniref:Uncharacterized protein n=1 Tax=Luteolibacter soli TaxID=3135280 RepID=A0ABU9AQC6_9BACT
MSALGPHLAVGVEPPVPPAQEKTEKPAYDRRAYDERNEALRRLLAESKELSRRVMEDQKRGRTGNTKEAMTRLVELQREIQRLEDAQIEENRKFQAAESDKSAVPQDADSELLADPSNLYFEGWLLSRDAEKLKTEGKVTDSRQKLERALKLFEQVASNNPDWKPEMVKGRLKQTKEVLSSLPQKDN